MEQDLENYRIKLQNAFDQGKVEEILEILKILKSLNVEIPFSVEVQEKKP